MRAAGELLHDESGVTAIEFALIASAFVFLMIGSFEIFSLIRVQDKLTHATKSMAKIIAQQNTVTGGSSGSIADICTGASRMMSPFSNGNLSAAIASVTTTTSGGSTTTAMDWESDNACPTAAIAMGKAAAIATASNYGLTPNSTDSVVIVKANYVFTSPVRLVLSSTYKMQQTGVARPRTGTTIPCTGC